jgi:hypothetical protein
VVPPQRLLQQTRTVKGGQVAAAGTIGTGAIGAIQETVGQAHEALAGVVPYLDAQLEAARHRPRDRGELARRMRNGRSDGAPCPPLVAYGQDFLGRAADELASLPAGSAIEQMLADYQVMREQARVCVRFGK